MKANMGSVDKVIRIILALLVGFLYYSDIISGNIAVILGVFAGVFLLTSFISFCPLYVIFGISTCKKPIQK
jgi:hypothetical protein